MTISHVFIVEVYNALNTYCFLYLMGYLTKYNKLAALLWTIVFFNVFKDAYIYFNPSTSYLSLYTFPKITRTYPHELLVKVQVFCSSMELFHSIVGVVSTPVSVAGMQALARLLIVLGICYKVPYSPANYSITAFSVMQIAWSISDVIRYAYYNYKLKGGNIPDKLTWFRYNGFLVLYPMGLFSELYIVYSTLNSVKGSKYYHFLVFALVAYVPGFLFLYTHMLSQRGKVLNKYKKLMAEVSDRKEN